MQEITEDGPANQLGGKKKRMFRSTVQVERNGIPISDWTRRQTEVWIERKVKYRIKVKI